MRLKKKTNYFLYLMMILIFTQNIIIPFSIPVNRVSSRLKKIFSYLITYVNYADESGVCYVGFPENFRLSSYCHFTHSRIVACQTNINVTKSIIPLILLWKEIDQPYFLMKDDVFLREFLILVYGASGELMMNSLNSENDHMRDIISHILSVYQKIDSLPLEEILNAIDILADEMPYLLEKYELNSSMTWKTWFKKYWWAPPLIVGTIAFQIWFQNLMRSHRSRISEQKNDT